MTDFTPEDFDTYLRLSNIFAHEFDKREGSLFVTEGLQELFSMPLTVEEFVQGWQAYLRSTSHPEINLEAFVDIHPSLGEGIWIQWHSPRKKPAL